MSRDAASLLALGWLLTGLAFLVFAVFETVWSVLICSVVSLVHLHFVLLWAAGRHVQFERDKAEAQRFAERALIARSMVALKLTERVLALDLQSDLEVARRVAALWKGAAEAPLSNDAPPGLQHLKAQCALWAREETYAHH